MAENKKIFGRQNLAVKNSLLLVYFRYGDHARVYYSIKFVGRIVNRKKPLSADNTIVFDEKDQFFIHDDEPLLTIDGKQRCLPKAVLACILSDNPSELEAALEKFAGVLRHSKPFSTLPRFVR